MKIKISGPQDGASLLASESVSYCCPVCDKEYPIEDGVLRVLDSNDEFYEGAYENQVTFLPKSERLHHIWPLWLINSDYLCPKIEWARESC